MERKIGGNQRIIQGRGPRGGGGGGWDARWLYLDISGSYDFFCRKRQNYGKGSVFIWNSGDITAQTRRVLQCHETHHPVTSHPFTWHLGYASFWLKAAVNKVWCFKQRDGLIRMKLCLYTERVQFINKLTGTRKLEKSTKAFPKLTD